MNPTLRARVLDALFDGEDASFVAQTIGAPEKEVYEIKRRIDRRAASHELVMELRNAVLFGGWRSVSEAIAEVEKLVDIFKKSGTGGLVSPGFVPSFYALPEAAPKVEAVVQMLRILEDWQTV